jgi:N-acetylmuramoyl-L-alanine amidase
MKKTICIDAGHGGQQPGAVGPKGTKESSITLAIALKLKALLVKDGHNVILTRDKDVMVVPGSVSADLTKRAKIANTAKSDLFISIHCNGLTPLVKGIETWYHNLVTPTKKNLIDKNKKYATLLYQEIIKKFPDHIKRRVHPDTERFKTGFGVLRPLEIPGALVELEFITNADMEKLLCDTAKQDLFVQALYEATKRYLEG